MFDTAKEFYQAAYFTSAGGALLSIPSSSSRSDGFGLLLLNGGMAIVTFLDYRAWRSLPEGLSGRIPGLGEFETFSVFLAFVSALLLAGLTTFPAVRIADTYRSAVFIFAVHTLFIVVYWLWLYFADSGGKYGVFSAMAATPDWATFSSSKLKATILTVALYLGTTIIAFILVWRPTFGPYGVNGYWNVAVWLSVMCALYAMFGPVTGFTKIVALLPLGVHLVLMITPLRTTLGTITRP